MQALNRLPLPSRAVPAGEACGQQRNLLSKPARSVHFRRALRVRAGEELHLVERKDQLDGSTLFVFGSASEAQAAKKSQQSKSKPSTASSSQQQNGKATAPDAKASGGGSASSTGTSNSKAASSSASSSPRSESRSTSPAQPQAEQTDYADLKVNDLKELCKSRSIKGYSTMLKAELIDVLQSNDAG